MCKICNLVFSITFFISTNSFSKENIKTTVNNIDVDSLISDMVKIDNNIDYIRFNKDNLLENLNTLKNELYKFNQNQFKLLVSIKPDKKNKEKFKLIKLYSSKIKIKLTKIKNSLNQQYRMSPSSKNTNSKSKDLLTLNLENEKIESELNELIKLSNSNLSSSKWLYNISK